LILIIFGTNVAEKVGNQKVFYFHTLLTSASALPGEMKKDKNSSHSLSAVRLHCKTSTSCWLNLLPAALRAAQTCWYLVYSEANFEVFRPAGVTRCTDGGEFWHGSSMPNFTPISAKTRV